MRILMNRGMSLAGASLVALGVAIVPVAAAAQTQAETPVSAAAPVVAAPDAATPAGLMDDIVVTANRREEAAQDVGIAINAFSGAQLEALGIRNSADITKFAPAVTTAGSQAGYLQTVSIRGVTQNDYNPHQEAPVAAYIDDVYISSVQGQGFATFDSDRIEILKGPQGTLFGRNATGGLVNYITRKPTQEWSGYVTGRYGRFDAIGGEGAVGGPINSILSFRVAGTYQRRDPIFRNLTGANGWAEKNYAARAHVLVEPSDDFSMLLSSRYGKADFSISGGQQHRSSVGILDAAGNQIDSRFLGDTETVNTLGPNGVAIGAPRPCGGCNFLGYRDPDGSGPITSDGMVGTPPSNRTSRTGNTSKALGFTVNMTGKMGDVTLTSISDYSYFKWSIATNLFGGGPKFGFDTTSKPIKQLSQELRLSGEHGPLRWTTGVYYLNISSDNTSAFTFLPPFGGTADQTFFFKQDTESISAFGQAELDLSSTVTLIAGGRYVNDKKRFDYRAEFRGPGDVVVPIPGFPVIFNQNTSSLANRSDDLWAAKLGINVKPNDDLLLYLTLNRGVKSGGFNALTNPFAGTTQDFLFAPEKLLSVEGGFKSSLLDRKLTLNGTAYYYDYGNYQAYQSVGVTNFITNKDARVYGAEVEIRANPIDNLSLLLGGAYTNSLVKDIQLAPGLIVDRRPSYSPKLSGSALIRYEIPSSVGTFAVQTDASYRSDYYLQITNYQDQKQKAYALVNVRTSLAGNDDAGWELAAAVENVTNKRYAFSLFSTSTLSGASLVTYNRPRSYEVSATYRF